MHFIDAATIARLVRPIDLLDPLRRAFAAAANIPARSLYRVETGAQPASLLIMPAWRDAGPLGVKLVTVVPDNSARGLPCVHAVYLYFHTTTGQLQAVLDGDALTLARTAAVSGLAADILAPAQARSLLMVGTGALAPYLIRMHAGIRALERIQLWGRTPENARRLAEQLRLEGLPVEAAADLESAVRTADIVSCATLSRTPLVRGEWLKDGAHLDLVGAFRPDMREADAAAIAAGGLAVDTLHALVEAGDLVEPLRDGQIVEAGVPDLAALVHGARPAPGRITVFKSVGTALSDLAAAEEVLLRLDAEGGSRDHR